MSTKTRPDGCCQIAIPVAELPVSERERFVSVFKALGDSTRLEVFRLIAVQEAPICVCDITDRFDVSQPTISHHLKVLREAGLISVSKRGIWSFYMANPRGLAVLEEAAQAIAISPVLALR